MADILASLNAISKRMLDNTTDVIVPQGRGNCLARIVGALESSTVKYEWIHIGVVGEPFEMFKETRVWKIWRSSLRILPKGRVRHGSADASLIIITLGSAKVQLLPARLKGLIVISSLPVINFIVKGLIHTT